MLGCCGPHKPSPPSSTVGIDPDRPGSGRLSLRSVGPDAVLRYRSRRWVRVRQRCRDVRYHGAPNGRLDDEVGAEPVTDPSLSTLRLATTR